MLTDLFVKNLKIRKKKKQILLIIKSQSAFFVSHSDFLTFV